MISNQEPIDRSPTIDPPWKGTGCGLGYDILDDNEWMDFIKIGDIMDDGIVFLWVTKIIGKRSLA